MKSRNKNKRINFKDGTRPREAPPKPTGQRKPPGPQKLARPKK